MAIIFSFQCSIARVHAFSTVEFVQFYNPFSFLYSLHVVVAPLPHCFVTSYQGHLLICSLPLYLSRSFSLIFISMFIMQCIKFCKCKFQWCFRSVKMLKSKEKSMLVWREKTKVALAAFDTVCQSQTLDLMTYDVVLCSVSILNQMKPVNIQAKINYAKRSKMPLVPRLLFIFSRSMCTFFFFAIFSFHAILYCDTLWHCRHGTASSNVYSLDIHFGRWLDTTFG